MAQGNPNGLIGIAANGTTVLGTLGAGAYLYGININKAGAAANVLQIYRGQTAAGVLIATIDTTVVRNFDFAGVHSTDGFTLVLGTGTAADLTVIYD